MKKFTTCKEANTNLSTICTNKVSCNLYKGDMQLATIRP